MTEMKRLEWDNAENPSADWDATEVPIETQEGYVRLCPFVAELPGPDRRAVYSIDVPNGHGSIRSLACGFADSLDDARMLAVEAINRMATGLKVA